MKIETYPYDGARDGAVCAACDPWQEPEGPAVATWQVREFDDAGEFIGAWPACSAHVPNPEAEGER